MAIKTSIVISRLKCSRQPEGFFDGRADFFGRHRAGKIGVTGHDRIDNRRNELGATECGTVSETNLNQRLVDCSEN